VSREDARFAKTRFFRWLDPRTGQIRDCTDLPALHAEVAPDVSKLQVRNEAVAREKIEQALLRREMASASERT